MKDSLRDTLKSQRATLSVDTQKEKSNQIIDYISSSDVFINAKRVAFYHAVRGEADPASINSQPDLDKQFFLPVLTAQSLLFAPVDTHSKYSHNKFSIPEPICKTEELVSADTLDLVLVPLLGFDKCGNRLGMGGGFYDRSFAFKKKNEAPPLLMGVAYDFQMVKKITTEPWDVKLDMIATENGLATFKS